MSTLTSAPSAGRQARQERDRDAGLLQDREVALQGPGASGTVALPGEIFDARTNVALIHQVVVGQLAAARQGTSSTKTRGEVRGGGRKPYRQKGTGRARQGSIRAPQFTGGGVVHGPTPRDYTQRTPKKMKAAALRGALSDRARGGRVHVVTSLVDGQTPSTKAAVAALLAIADSRHVLVVAEAGDAVTHRSLRNAPSVHLLVPGQLNTYDVLVCDDIVFTEAALEAFLTTRVDSEPTAVPTGTGAEPAVASVPTGADRVPASDRPVATPVLDEADPELSATPAPPSDTTPTAAAADAGATDPSPTKDGE